MKQRIVNHAILVGLVVLCASCHKQVAARHPLSPVAVPPPAEAKAAPVPAPTRPEPASVKENSTPASPSAETKARIQDLLNRIQDIYFDYDKHVIRPDAEATLRADAKALRAILAQYPTYKLTIQGFCDERGSDEYNLALGDSRAETARDYLETLGLPGSQLATVSFGKERPVCTEHNEACWQRNRRAHITQEKQPAS